MSELFDRLFLLPEQDLYTEGSPLLIEAGALNRNSRTGKLVAQLKLKNLSPRPIQGALVQLTLLDADNAYLGETVDYRYLDLQVARDESFGVQTPIRIDDPAARAFTVRLLEAVFADGETWRAPAGAVWASLPRQLTTRRLFADLTLNARFHQEHGKDADYIPQRVLDLWRCTCGAVNRSEETLCHACSRPFFEHTEADTERMRADFAQEESRKAEPVKSVVQEAEAQALQSGQRRKAGRFFGRLLCAALVIASVYLLMAFPAIRLTGNGLETFLADVDWQVTDSFDFSKDVLLHSDSFDRAAIEAAGVDLSEKNVVPLLDRTVSVVRSFTDGDLSLKELLQGTLLTQELIPVADDLFSTEADFGLFKALGIEDSYATCKTGYASYHKLAQGALIGFEAFLGLMGLFALGSVLMSLFGKRRVFDVLLLIAEVLLVALFGAAVYFGSPLLAQLGMPSSLKLSMDVIPALSVPAIVVMLIVKRMTLGRRK